MNLTQTVSDRCCYELADHHRKIEHCVSQLSEADVWWRPAPELNSIGNLILHVSGNLRQWIVCGVGDEADQRDRQSEFDADGSHNKAELIEQLRATVSECRTVIESVSEEALVSPRVIQDFDTTGFGAILHSICHLNGHVQEIIHMTRHRLGKNYRFAFVPSEAQQGPSQSPGSGS